MPSSRSFSARRITTGSISIGAGTVPPSLPTPVPPARVSSDAPEVPGLIVHVPVEMLPPGDGGGRLGRDDVPAGCPSGLCGGGRLGLLEEVVEATELVGSFGLRLGTEGRDLVVPSSALAALLVVSATAELVPFTPGCGGLRRGGVISPAGANFRGANTCRGGESTRSVVAAVPSTALNSFSSRSKLPAGSCSSQAFCKKKLARASASSAGELGSSIRVFDASARRRRLPCLCRSKQTTNTPHRNVAGQWRQAACQVDTRNANGPNCEMFGCLKAVDRGT
eukprot:COSAG05_NODE_1981_length_3754_cov_8.506156_5_plen_280_part_00